MGSGQSIFYPDNTNRRSRAQQLADDCQYAQQQFDATKAALKSSLGPLKDKLDKVLAAFNCNTVLDLDHIIQASATGQALQNWNNVKKTCDTGDT